MFITDIIHLLLYSWVIFLVLATKVLGSLFRWGAGSASRYNQATFIFLPKQYLYLIFQSCCTWQQLVDEILIYILKHSFNSTDIWQIHLNSNRGQTFTLSTSEHRESTEPVPQCWFMLRENKIIFDYSSQPKKKVSQPVSFLFNFEAFEEEGVTSSKIAISESVFLCLVCFSFCLEF